MNSRSFAIVVLLALAVVRPSRAALAEELGEINRLHHAGQTQAALEQADKILTTRPKEAQVRFLKAVLLTDAGRPDEATALLEQLTNDYPELAEPHNNLAAMHAAAGRYDQARAELEESLRLNPGYALAYENLGDVHAMLAARSYARALRLEPASATLPVKLRSMREIGVSTAPTVAVAAPASASAPR